MCKESRQYKFYRTLNIYATLRNTWHMFVLRWLAAWFSCSTLYEEEDWTFVLLLLLLKMYLFKWQCHAERCRGTLHSQ